MKQTNFEIVFNNGELRQILMLPETPLKIAFIFAEKELILREQKDVHGLYVISHQRGFPETNINNESDQKSEATYQNKAFEDNRNLSDLEKRRDISFEGFGESSKSCVKKQALSTIMVQRLINVMKGLNNLKEINNGSFIWSNNLTSMKGTINTSPEQNVSLEPLQKSNVVGIPIKSIAVDKGSVNYEETICPQHKTLSNVPTQRKATNVQLILTKPNIPATLKSFVAKLNVPIVKQNNLTTKKVTTLENNSNVEYNQNVRTHDMESNKVDNCEISSVINNSSDEDDMMIDTGPCWSDISDDVDDSVDILTKEFHSTPKSKNKSSHIRDNKSQQKQETRDTSSDPKPKKKEDNRRTTNSTNQPKKKKLFRRCVICFSRNLADGLHRFPSCCEISNLWAKASGRKWVINATPRIRQKRFSICSKHFATKDFVRPGSRRLNWSAVPSQNLTNSSKISATDQLNTDILERMKSKLQLALHKSSPEKPKIKKFHSAIIQDASTSKSLPKVKVNPIRCCVPQCRSTKARNPKCSFHNLPQEDDTLIVKMHDMLVSVNRRQEWIKLLKIPEPVTNGMLVCSRHFLASDIILPTFELQAPRLRKNIMPSQHLPAPLTEGLVAYVNKSLV